jgi:hypothetical protein
VRGISYSRVDCLGVKRRVLVGYVGIEELSRLGALAKIDLARLLLAATAPGTVVSPRSRYPWSGNWTGVGGAVK